MNSIQNLWICTDDNLEMVYIIHNTFQYDTPVLKPWIGQPDHNMTPLRVTDNENISKLLLKVLQIQLFWMKKIVQTHSTNFINVPSVYQNHSLIPKPKMQMYQLLRYVTGKQCSFAQPCRVDLEDSRKIFYKKFSFPLLIIFLEYNWLQEITCEELTYAQL